MKRIKIKKRMHRRTVEAYVSACLTPDDCIANCNGTFDSFEASVIAAAATITG